MLFAVVQRLSGFHGVVVSKVDLPVRMNAHTFTSACALQVKSPGDMRNFDAEKAKAPVDTGYKSTGLFTDF